MEKGRCEAGKGALESRDAGGKATSVNWVIRLGLTEKMISGEKTWRRWGCEFQGIYRKMILTVKKTKAKALRQEHTEYMRKTTETSMTKIK